MEEGLDVPEVFREHRHAYSDKPKDITAYRKQIMYRCGHIGTKELEIVLRDWLELNSGNMSYEDLEQFDKDVLDIENPQMQRYLMNGDPIQEQHNTKYMNILVKYVDDRKVDFAGNVPEHRKFQ